MLKIRKTVHRSEVKNSEEWNRSIGKKGLSITCDHYRKGRKHAVFSKNEDWGEIHEDKEAAHVKPLGHLLKDAPEVLATGALIAGSIVSLKFRKKK